MHVIGWGLLCSGPAHPVSIRQSAVAVRHGATTYTPGVAFWGLCLVFFLGLAVSRWREHRPEALAWLSCAIFQSAVGCASLFVRLDLRLLPQERDLPKNFLTGLKVLFFGDPYFFLSPVLLLPILLYLLYALAFRAGLVHFVLCVWCLATCAVSIAAQGVASPSADIALQRALVVVPVLATGMAWAFLRLAAPAARRALDGGRLAPHGDPGRLLRSELAARAVVLFGHGARIGDPRPGRDRSSAWAFPPRARSSWASWPNRAISTTFRTSPDTFGRTPSS